MTALTAEPWRGAARADHYVTAAPANFRSAWVECTVSSPQPTGDQAIWDGNPGDSLTLRFKWTQGGVPVGDAPTFATVEMRLPGGAIVGAAWTVAFPAVDTEVTRTFHFDSYPLNQALGSIRSGTLELYLNWGSTGGIVPWNADSRGGGTPAALNSIDNARGYVRSYYILSGHSISDVSVGGAEPAAFYATDPVHTRITLSAVSYRANQPVLSLRRPSNGTAERQETDGSLTVADRDFSWTSSSSGLTAYIGAGMEPSSTTATRTTEAKDLRLDLPTLDFGGDNEYAYATTGHQATWVRDSAVSMRYPARITVDPRVYLTSGDLTDWDEDRGALFHTQNQGVEMLDPPSGGDIETGQRVLPDVAYLASRLVNGGGIGLNGVTATIKTWDVNGIASTEGTPAHTLTRVTETRREDAPQTVPEIGWLPREQAGADNDKLPLTWTVQVSGTWRVKTVITSPSALVGTENHALSGGADTWDRNVFFVAALANYEAAISIHPSDITHHGTHLVHDDLLIPIIKLIDHTDHSLVALVESNGDSVHITATREHHPTMRMDYFDFDIEAWVEKADGGVMTDIDCVRGSAHTAGGDPDIWTVLDHIGGTIFEPDPVAGELDITIHADITKDGVHYTAFIELVFVGQFYKHNDSTGSSSSASGGSGQAEIIIHSGSKKKDIQEIKKIVQNFKTEIPVTIRNEYQQIIKNFVSIDNPVNKEVAALAEKHGLLQEDMDALLALVMAKGAV